MSFLPLLNERIDDSALGGFGTRTSYAPAWTTTLVAPTMGNGTIHGEYIVHGNLCYFTMTLIGGTTTRPGTGNWRFSLPFAHGGALPTVCPAFINDSGSTAFAAIGYINAGASVIRLFALNAGSGGMSEAYEGLPPFSAGGVGPDGLNDPTVFSYLDELTFSGVYPLA